MEVLNFLGIILLVLWVISFGILLMKCVFMIRWIDWLIVCMFWIIVLVFLGLEMVIIIIFVLLILIVFMMWFCFVFLKSMGMFFFCFVLMVLVFIFMVIYGILLNFVVFVRLLLLML